MGVLIGLEGKSIEEMECEFIEKISDIKRILDSGMAAIDANSNGAIHIWKDDEGFIRCEAMRHYLTIDSQRFSKMKDVKEWAKRWILEIE